MNEHRTDNELAACNIVSDLLKSTHPDVAAAIRNGAHWAMPMTEEEEEDAILYRGLVLAPEVARAIERVLICRWLLWADPGGDGMALSGRVFSSETQETAAQ